VATVRSLKYNGGIPKDELTTPNLEALKKGIVNLEKHIENLQSFNIPIVVTLNRFISDTTEEIDYVKDFCEKKGCKFAISEVWEKGSEGGIELAKEVLKAIDSDSSQFAPIYPLDIPIKDKILAIATKIYGAKDVSYTSAALKEISHLTEMGLDNTPVCIAKTQYSLSDDPKKLGRPEDFTLNVRDVYASSGAGFIVVITGNVMTMPGLPKKPAAYNIDITDDGKITGLF
jgi:formate--tetrahydrofolate ligase